MNYDDETKFRKVKISEAIKPKCGLFQIYVDYWWVVTNQEEIIFYVVGGANSPQCNLNESIANRFSETLSVKQIPVVYVPINPRDYC